ncbi:TRAFAC clade GTPase domain-containing protein [Kitasatospora azatica]|uniref:TRAFAC clade GTPase domain-containing protein n=1 Tax=Kitasatospora azatica TaxID=58347 RepID=UPI00055C0FD2|nr:aromatic ring-opening dioxygenase LigA [Kitasatospora azatica]
MTDVVCPYCFSRDSSSRLPYRCLMLTSGVRGAAPCAAEPDDVWAAFTGRGGSGGGRHAALRGPLFTPPRRLGGARTREACPNCGVQTPVRVCRTCHSDLPNEYCEQGSRIIALVGPKTAGKSTAVTVLLHELKGSTGRPFQAALSAMGAATQDRFRELEEDLYDGLRLPAPTQSAAMSLNDPLLFRLSLPAGRLRSGSRHTSLVFFDAAGENLVSSEAMDRYTAYLAAADGVILMVDPLQLRAVREPLAQQGRRLPDIEAPPEQIVADLAVQLRGHGRRNSQGRVTTPVAVALTKSDELRTLLPAGSPVGGNPQHLGGELDEADRIAVHEEVRALLDEWDGGVLYRQLERDFQTFSLFALSALGAPPPSDAPSDAPKQGPQPVRVADPLLWLLGVRRLLPVRRAK